MRSPKARRRHLGCWLLLLLAGCAGQTEPTETAQRQCEAAGGVWRTSQCERSAGGGY